MYTESGKLSPPVHTGRREELMLIAQEREEGKRERERVLGSIGLGTLQMLRVRFYTEASDSVRC